MQAPTRTPVTAFKKSFIVVVAGGAALLGTVYFGVYRFLGVWPPDVGSSKVSLLTSAESASGERFRVVQFWNGYDFYTTQVEHTAADGMLHVAVIDGDDHKQWPCSSRVIEAEKKFVITLSDGSPPIEYLWDTKWFVTLPGWVRVRE